MKNKVIFLVDMESFYVSVEKADHLELNNRPVIVSGDPERRSGVVLAACSVAKKHGVKNASRLGEAQLKCPNAVVIRPRMQKYLEVSLQITNVLERFTDQVEPYSIDEQFLDVTGSQNLLGLPWEMAKNIQEIIKKETQIQARVGIGPNKFLAKMACEGFAKKNASGIFELNANNMKQFMWTLPIDKMHGVGERMSEHLCKMGMRTIGDLATYPLSTLKKRWGIPGQVLWETANGIDASPVIADSHSNQKAIGHAMTLPRDYSSKSDIKVVLLELCEEVCRRARSASVMGRTVSISVHGANVGSPTGFHRQVTLLNTTNNTMDVYRTALELFERFWDCVPIRRISAGLSNLCSADSVQLDLFNNVIRKRDLDYTVDSIKNRFGDAAIVHASSLTDAGQAYHRAATIGGHYK
ncbi:DNA polymerase IV [Salicibibacter cibi]|uniref:DNA polymerase IV n=1 Tax=Salicibibacter cibi TaxID=2743001 RepID=A0A7T6Z8T7_9BACI|nr:DNA polymerase IV [Salicibibacter cibi]QQK78982.1 DNA polymerase IV [Salicibibacter cibi]